MTLLKTQKVISLEAYKNLSIPYDVDKICAISTIRDLLDYMNHVRREDVEPLKGFANAAADFDPELFVDDARAGLVFIEMMYAAIYRQSPDVEPRQDQIRGSKLMYLSSYFKANMFGEYPTGSGKSFMYLIFAAAAAFVRGEASTVVTSGINLQEQLEAKDMPYISNIYKIVTGETILCGLIKGRQNYVCNKKLEAARTMIRAGVAPIDVENLEEFKAYVRAIPVAFNGDISNVPVSASRETIAALTVKSKRDGGCGACDLFDNCYFYKHQRNTTAAAIKVINYHILFTEVEKLKSLGYLSGISNNYIFDEAHEFSAIGRAFSERKFSKFSITHLKAKVTEIDDRINNILGKSSSMGFSLRNQNLDQIIEDLEDNFATHSYDWYQSRKNKYYDDIIIEDEDNLNVGSIIFGLNEVGSYLEDDIQSRLEAIGFGSMEQLYGAEYAEEGRYENELDVLEPIHDLLKELYDHLSLIRMFGDSNKRNESDIIWISKDRDDRLSLKSKAVDVRSMKPLFESLSISTVSVSATLAVNGGFSFYRQEMNIPRSTVSFEVVGPSPFNLREQELWYIPKNALSGAKKDTDEDVYMNMVIDNIDELLTASRGGMMALFTSVRSMNAAYMEISRRHPHMNIMVQNNLPRKQLIDAFRKDVHSVLFATRSFFTGVDIKGPSLRVLVLDKLPFDNPSDPVTRVLTSRENGFRNYAIPSMVMILKQIIGRGVRSKDDKCVIAFMDVRLKTASYARQIQRTFKSTGNFSKRTHSFEDVQSFMDTIIHENGLFAPSTEDWDPDEIPF